MKNTLVAMSAMVGLWGLGCTAKHKVVHDSRPQPSQGQAPVSRAVLRLAVDPNVLVTNAGTTVPVGLQQEIKRQFLDAVAFSGLLQESSDATGALVLKEIGIARTETTKLDVDVTVDGTVNVKSAPVEGDDSAPPALGANVSMNTHVVSSSYTIAFAFEDKTEGGKGEIVRVRLSSPLQVEEKMSVASRVKLSFNMIKALPPHVGMIVARFIDSISLSLDAGVAWEHSTELSSRMFFKATDGKATALVRDFMKEIVEPVCKEHAAKRGLEADACVLRLPVIDNPVDALEKRFASGVTEVARCEETGERENFIPLYKLYFKVPRDMISYRAGDQIHAFEKDGSDWKRVQSAKVLGVTASPDKCGALAAGMQCVVAQLGMNWFEGRCSGSNDGSGRRLGVSAEERTQATL